MFETIIYDLAIIALTGPWSAGSTTYKGSQCTTTTKTNQWWITQVRSRDHQNQGQVLVILETSSLLLNEVRHGVPMVQLRQKRYEMLGKPYSTCNHTSESQQSCLYRCKLKKIKLKCGCVPFFSQSEDSKHCSIMEQELV